VDPNSCWVTNFWISYSYWCWVWKLKAVPPLQKRGWIPLHREGSTRLCVMCNVKVLHCLSMGYESLLLMYPVKYEWITTTKGSWCKWLVKGKLHKSQLRGKIVARPVSNHMPSMTDTVAYCNLNNHDRVTDPFSSFCLRPWNASIKLLTVKWILPNQLPGYETQHRILLQHTLPD